MSRITAQDVILEILRNSDGEWIGKTRLFKAFYFAHLYYALKKPGILTDWPIARMPQGPGIHKSQKLFDDLVNNGLMRIEQTHEGPYCEYRYRLTDKGRESAVLSLEASEAIRLATVYCEGRSALSLSQETHERSRSWNQAKDGEILEIYIDIIPDDEYQRRQEDINRLDACLTEAINE